MYNDIEFCNPYVRKELNYRKKRYHEQTEFNDVRLDGSPCIFYLDLYGVSYWNKDNDGNDYDIFLDKVPHIEELIKARVEHAYGAQSDYFEDSNNLVWIRESDESYFRHAVLLSNKDGYTKPIKIGKIYKNKTEMITILISFFILLGIIIWRNKRKELKK